MNDKPKYARELALAVAKELGTMLKPFVEQVAIAGSLRRGKAIVSDIELLFVPKFETVPEGLFDKVRRDLAAPVIEQMLVSGVIVKRPSATAVFTWGKLNKLAIHCASGIPVDFFTEPDAADWPRSMVIRTGPKDFNVRLMATAPRNGYQAHAYGEAMHRIPGGQRVICRDEKEFIEKCGLPFVEPRFRK